MVPWHKVPVRCKMFRDHYQDCKGEERANNSLFIKVSQGETLLLWFRVEECTIQGKDARLYETVIPRFYQRMRRLLAALDRQTALPLVCYMKLKST